MNSRKAILVNPRHFEMSEEEITIGPGQVLVKMAACGLCNWELNFWKGLLGDFPQSLGHEGAGEIVTLGEGVEGLQPGDRVTGFPTALNNFADYAVYNASDCYKVHHNVNLKYAVGEPLKCIVTVLRAAAPSFGDYGAVFGCGPMGLWCIQGMAGNLLSAIIAVDIDDQKLELAKKFGAHYTINPNYVNVEEKIREITDKNMVDFAIEGSGNPSVVNNALSCLKSRKGRLILMSSYESEAAPFNLKVAMEKSVEVIFPHPGYCDNPADDMRRAVTALNNEVFKNDQIVSHVFLLNDIQKAFETLENKPLGYLKGIVIP